MRRIFKHFINAQGKKQQIILQWFVDTLGVECFEDIDKMIYLFMKYCSDLSLPLSEKALEMFKQTEAKKLMVRNAVKLDTIAHYDYKEINHVEEAYLTVAATLTNAYTEYLNAEVDTELGIKAVMATYFAERSVDLAKACISEKYIKLATSSDITDVDNLVMELSSIRETYSDEAIEELDLLLSEVESSEKNNHPAGKPYKLYDTGIPVIDNDTGGIYTKMLLTLAAQPGAGKTRWTLAHHVYPCAVLFGHGVIIDEQEMDETEIENILIAHHILYLYKGQYKIPDELIRKDILSDEQRRIVESARYDLFNSGKYGRIIIRADVRNVNQMKNQMIKFFKNNSDIKLWVTDYAGLWEHKLEKGEFREPIEAEIIKKGYKIVKRITAMLNIAAVVINQYNGEGIKAAEDGKNINAGHIQGGQIVHRHTMYDIAFTMTEEQKLAQVMSMSSTKTRVGVGFRNIPIQTDRSVSIFKQVAVQNKS